MRSFSGCFASGAVANTAQDQGACWAEFDFYREYIAVLPQGIEFERNIRTRGRPLARAVTHCLLNKIRRVFDTRLSIVCQVSHPACTQVYLWLLLGEDYRSSQIEQNHGVWDPDSSNCWNVVSEKCAKGNSGRAPFLRPVNKHPFVHAVLLSTLARFGYRDVFVLEHLLCAPKYRHEAEVCRMGCFLHAVRCIYWRRLCERLKTKLQLQRWILTLRLFTNLCPTSRFNLSPRD